MKKFLIVDLDGALLTADTESPIDEVEERIGVDLIDNEIHLHKFNQYEVRYRKNLVEWLTALKNDGVTILVASSWNDKSLEFMRQIGFPCDSLLTESGEHDGWFSDKILTAFDHLEKEYEPTDEDVVVWVDDDFNEYGDHIVNGFLDTHGVTRICTNLEDGLTAEDYRKIEELFGIDTGIEVMV